MKKHQLLEKAMRDYPAGTIARFKSAPHVDHISDGVFHVFEQFDDDNNHLEISILCGAGNCVYSNGEWAVPVVPSILTARCAIHINNEREFKLLMDYYEGKGWKSYGHDKPSHLPYKYKVVAYGDGLFHNTKEMFVERDYTIISFADFAAEVGITVPKFIMKSEDCVNLYEGDKAHHVFEGHGLWCYIGCFTVSQPTIVGKIFSTKEAAEAWIDDQNRPKEIILGEGTMFPVRIHQKGIEITFEKGVSHTKSINFCERDIIEIYEAFKSLQSC